jgi:hypothetical protein
MNTMANRMFALLLAASLTFGVTSVFAQVGVPCDNPPTLLGACSSQEECHSRCLGYGGFQGDCVTASDGTTCCICAI